MRLGAFASAGEAKKPAELRGIADTRGLQPVSDLLAIPTWHSKN